MSARQWRIGAGIAVAFPLLLHLTLQVIQYALNRETADDFQYHDSYMLAVHVGWSGYVGLGLGAFLFYGLAVLIYRTSKFGK